MKKLLSVFVSISLILLLSQLGEVKGFAAELSENYSMAQADVQIDDYPMITNFVPVENGVKVSWTEYAEASKYRLYILSDGKWKKLCTTASTNFVHENLVDGTSYIYTVRALNTEGSDFISGYNSDGWENTYFKAPEITSLINTNDGVLVRWSSGANVGQYRIYRKTNNSGWSYIGDSDSTIYVDKTASSGTNYTYTVRCLNLDGKLVSYYNSGKSITYVNTPKISKIENTATGAKISWSNCSGASKYRVFYLDSNNTWKGLGNTTSTSYTHDKLKTGTTYTYTVRCLDSKGNFVSGYDKTGASNMFITTPTISSLTNINSGVQVKWGKLSGADSYRIYRKTKNSGWSYIGDSDSTTYVDIL